MESCRRFPEISRKTSTFLQETGAEKPIRFLDIASCAGRGKTTTWDDRLRNKSTDPRIWMDLGPGWFRFACCATLARVPYMFVSVWCILRFTVRSCVKGSNGFRCIISLLWVLWIIMSILVWVVVLVPVKRFRTNDFIPLRTDVVGTWSIRCNRLSLESRAGYTVEVTVN